MNQYQELAARLDQMERRLNAAASPRLMSSTIIGGAVPIRSTDGQLTGLVGQQWDGTFGSYALAGPPPPTPSAPQVFVIPGIGIRVHWDGLFADGPFVVAPMGFTRVEVHIGPDPLSLGMLQPRTTIESPRGGDVSISTDLDTPLYVVLVARTEAGGRSPASGAAGPYTVSRPTAEDLDVDFEGLRGTKVFYGPTEPTTTVADLWFQTPQNIAWRYDPGLQNWVQIRDTGITQALADAAAAHSAAVSAGNAAIAAQQTANKKASLFRQATAPTTGMVLNDYWVDSDDNQPYIYTASGWVAIRDSAINTALTNAATAQATADGKMRIFTQTSAPTGMVAGDVGDLWIDTDDSNVSYTWSGTAWVKRQIGNGAIVPQSLVLSQLAVTGSVTAALLEAIMVLATTIIAGDPLGTHSRMTPTGFRVFRKDPVDGSVDEVARLGTDTDDYFGIIDNNGKLVASIDDSGSFNGRSANFADDITVMGQSFSSFFSRLPGEVRRGTHLLPEYASRIGPIQSEYGLAQYVFPVRAGRTYSITVNGPQFDTDITPEGLGEVVIRYRVSTSGNATINSFEQWAEIYNGYLKDNWQRALSVFSYDATQTGFVYLLVTMQSLHGRNSSAFGVIGFTVNDAGPTAYGPTTRNNGGGTLYQGAPPPPPPAAQTQYYTGDILAAGKESFRGNGSLRTDIGGDVYQGWDPSGYNGDQKGYWWYNLPNITGTVDRVDLELDTSHWYYNSGGTAIINITDWRGSEGSGFFKLRPNLYVGGYQKPGRKTISLPSDWLPYFKGTNNNAHNGRAMGITLGSSGGTDLLYYGKFTRFVIRVWYTQ